MAQPQPEQRGTRRFSLDLPISVTFLENGTYEITGRARDVSSRGVFFYVRSDIHEGSAIEFVMTLPAEITLGEPIRVRCSGKVIRVETTGREQSVAVAIDKYDFVRET